MQLSCNRVFLVVKILQEILDCDQSNVLLARIILVCILGAFSFVRFVLETRRLIETRLIL